MRHRRGLALLPVCLVAALGAGCDAFHLNMGMETDARPPIEDTTPDLAEARLVEAAVRAEAALAALARIQAAETAAPAVETPVVVPAVLRRPVTLDWIGPVETLTETLATRAGYRFVAAGAPPVRPVLVAIAAEDTPLIEVLRDAGIQAGTTATVTVDAERRTVRLDWTGEHPGTGERPGTAPGRDGA